MPTQLLSVGMPWVLTQNVVYALPAKLVNVTTSAACEVSADGTTFVALVSGTNTSAAFIRSALVGTTVVCKAAD